MVKEAKPPLLLTAPALFDVKQFISAKVEVALENTTTQTELRGGKKIIGKKEQKAKAGDNNVAHLLELRDRGIVLEVPPHSGSVGHHLTLELTARFPDGTEAFFQTTAKIESIEPTDSERVSLAAGFVQFEEDQWRTFRAAFGKRQDEILEFLKSAKGQ